MRAVRAARRAVSRAFLCFVVVRLFVDDVYAMCGGVHRCLLRCARHNIVSAVLSDFSQHALSSAFPA